MQALITDELRQWLRAQVAAGSTQAQALQAMQTSGWSPKLAQRAWAEFAVSPDAGAQAPPAMPGLGPEATAGSVDVGDRCVQVLAHLHRPALTLLAGLLSDDECQALIDAARPRMQRSLTVHNASGGQEVSADRTSAGMFFERAETALVQRIEARIACLLHWPVDNGEGLQVLHYRGGAQYKPHYDYFDPNEPGTPSITARGGQRLGTLIIYLNEPLRGGATTFPDMGLELLPKKGNAVFFSYDRPHPSTRTLHGGAPVLEGEKWVATKWLRQRAFA